jgi:signal transduction histidine kinase/ActR/RegA family two-component response regulator
LEHAVIEMLDSSPNGGDAARPEFGTKLVATDAQMNRNPGQSEVSAVAARGGLFRKYVVMFVAIVSLALAINGVSDIWFSYHEQQDLLIRIQREQADSAAEKIGQFLNDITAGLAWETQLSWSDNTLDEWQFDAVRLLRQVPALTEIVQLDATGREQFRMSREAPDVIASHVDHSQDTAFIQAMANKVYYGPVYFIDESQPYMTIAMAGVRPEFGVIVAQVNLTFIWDVISPIKVGKHGQAYVVDESARLIAHPDISQVLRKTDISGLAQVQAARAAESSGLTDQPLLGVDITGRRVLSTYAVVKPPEVSNYDKVKPPEWLVFAELPLDEAYAPLYESAFRSGIVILVALLLAIFAGLLLARRMVVPIRALRDGAVSIGSGDLGQRISINTGDELEALGDQFNAMAARLQESYAGLESKVEERTRQLEAANQAKSRFIAAASHDLRQPLHALGLFVAQLHGRLLAAERSQIIGRIEAALSAMNELFAALLDISKLDAGATAVNITVFPVAQLLAHAETTFAGAAREKKLSFRALPSDAWVRSDFILLEQIVFNLVTNALRYTRSGGVLVGCRKRGDQLRIEVWDSGIGIAPDQHDKIFGEFYRLGEPDRDRRAGLGLGLAIVDRLCRLLDHPIEVKSTVGKGSVFAVTVPLAPADKRAIEASIVPRSQPSLSHDKLVLVIDDDPLVLEGMGGIFRKWGCRVVTADSDSKALKAATAQDDVPDLIISDYHLANGRTGIATIEWLRGELSAQIPAFLISGDTDPATLHEAKVKGFYLLHKPVDPMALRAMFNQAVKPVPRALVRKLPDAEETRPDATSP